MSTSTGYADPLMRAETALRAALGAITAEIQAYPTPISGCDAQYNHLIGQRRQISDALSALSTPAFVATPRSLWPGAGVEAR